MEKDFDKWNERKKALNDRERILFNPREIWWCSFGVNIGSEQDGSGDNFERPVVIIKKLSPNTFFVAPLSTKEKLEKFQSPIKHSLIFGFALLDQIRVIDSKRLLRKIGMTDEIEFNKMKNKLAALLL